MLTNKQQTDWDLFLPSILFGYQTSPAVSTGESLFYLLYGREPRLPLDVSLLPPSNLSKSIEFHRARIVKNIEIAHNFARANILAAQLRMKEYHDRRAIVPNYNVGDRVWVFTPRVPTGLSKKLRHLWHVPYRVVEKLSEVHFVLRTCDNRRVAAIIHSNHMKPYCDPAQRPIDTPNDIDNDDLCLCKDELPSNSFESEPTHSSQHAHNPPTNNDTPVTLPDPIQFDPNEPIFQAEKIINCRKR